MAAEPIQLIIDSEKLESPELMELALAVLIKTAGPKPIDDQTEVDYSTATILDIIDSELLLDMHHLNTVLRSGMYRDLEPEELLIYRVAAVYASARFGKFFNFRIETLVEDINIIPSKKTKLQCWRAVKEVVKMKNMSDRKRNSEWISASNLVAQHYRPEIAVLV